jgi:DNA-binding SARP family transcriptional activator
VDHYSLRLLGRFAVHHGNRLVELPPGCRRLVALAALKRKPVHRLWVCATLWPRAQTDKAMGSLRSTMWRLRPVGAKPLLVADPQYIRLTPDVSVDWYDAVDLIERLLDGAIDAQLVSELLPLLRAGELLDRWPERWVTRDRDRYHEMRAKAFEVLGHTADKPKPQPGLSTGCAVRPGPTFCSDGNERSEP